MILSYVYRTGQEQAVELCLLATKPDQFSVPVAVSILPETTGGVLRLGPYEAATVRHEDGWTVIAPVDPSQLFLTPPQADRPGTIVKKARVKIDAAGLYTTEFQQEKDVSSGTWRAWEPLKMAK